MSANVRLLEIIGYTVEPDRGIPQRYIAIGPNGKHIAEPLLSRDAAWLECQEHFRQYHSNMGKFSTLPTIGARLRLLRGNHSQAEIATCTSLSTSHISMFEAGTRIPSINQLAMLLSAFDISLSQFFDGYNAFEELNRAQRAKENAEGGER